MYSCQLLQKLLDNPRATPDGIPHLLLCRVCLVKGSCYSGLCLLDGDGRRISLDLPLRKLHLQLTCLWLLAVCM